MIYTPFSDFLLGDFDCYSYLRDGQSQPYVRDPDLPLRRPFWLPVRVFPDWHWPDRDARCEFD
ncbi:MAG: hypothetical protein AAB776_00295 [Patescibacteria group bacterium]